LEGQKATIGRQGHSLGDLVARWAKMTPELQYLSCWAQNMARPASYMSENVNFRPRWTRMKSLGENIDPNMRIWLFNHVSTRVLGDSSFCTKRNTLGAWERLLESIRGVGKLSLLLLGFPSSSMEVLPLLGWRG